MDFVLNQLSKNQPYLIICPDEIKKKLFKIFFKQKQIYDIKWLNKTQFINAQTFEIDEMAFIHASHFLNKESSITKEMLSYLPYIEDVHLNQSKHINELINLKQFLISHNLIKHTAHFEYLYKDRIIYVIGYEHKDKLFQILGKI